MGRRKCPVEDLVSIKRFLRFMPNPLQGDLDLILAKTEGLWNEIRGKRIFITGGTGFFGCWLLESFIWANEKLGLNASAVVLSRTPEAFQKKAPHLALNPAVELLTGDVRTFRFPSGSFSHIIHGATESSSNLEREDPLQMVDTIVDGTRRVLEFGCHSGARKVLLISSGKVYGKQPPDLTHIPENYLGAPDPADSGSWSSEGKRLAELLAALYSREKGIETKIARCFTLVGPHLPLDVHFAAGNFIRDAMAGGPIVVGGDGTPYRSYLYTADLAVWLWTILIKGQPARPYNVGSENEITIAQLATAVAGCFRDNLEVRIAKQPAPGRIPERYVPATRRARIELNLQQTTDLGEAIRKTVGWHDPDAPIS